MARLSSMSSNYRSRVWLQSYHVCCPSSRFDLSSNIDSCICGKQFCYLCLAVWKTCTCENFSQSYLRRRPVNIATLQTAVPPPTPSLNARAIAAEAEARRLDLQKDCAHKKYTFNPGRYRCETCWDSLSGFIYTCDHCSMKKCRRCWNGTWGEDGYKDKGKDERRY